MNNQRRALQLSIVFSFFNEEDVIPTLVQRTRAVMAEAFQKGFIRGYELIFVNDASRDNSAAALLKLAEEKKDIRIINMSRSFGVAPCVLAGLAYSKGEAVVYMDADLQDPPEVILKMLDNYINDPLVEVVHTLRTDRKGESRFKLFLTSVGYNILNRYSSVSIPKNVGDFKLISRRVVDHILQFKENKPFMRGLIAWVGFKQNFIPYTREARFAGKSKFLVLGEKVISNFFNAAIVNFSSVPLQIASYCGLFAIILDFLVIFHALYEKLSGRAIPGWTALMIIILFIGGVQLFCLGMIGLYLQSVHDQTKMRPGYIVDSTYGFETTT